MLVKLIREAGGFPPELPLSEFCVYTVRHPDDLRNALESAEPTVWEEGRVWTQGRRLLDAARRDNTQLPILFGDATDCLRLTHWVILSRIDVDSKAREYEFHSLRRHFNLGDNKKQAWAKYHDLMARRGTASSQPVTVAELFEIYLEWCAKRRSQGTYNKNRRYPKSFIEHDGERLYVTKLKPHHKARKPGTWILVMPWPSFLQARPRAKNTSG